jgi:hypothetical protein
MFQWLKVMWPEKNWALQRWTKPGRKDLLPLFVCIPPGDAAGEIEHDYPLVNIQKTMENHHAINGKTHYFDWAIFNSYVKLPEGSIQTDFN